MNDCVGEVRKWKRSLLIVEGKQEKINQYQLEDNEYKECFESSDLTEVLKVQNIASQNDDMGFIWVLNTCVFFVAEYNFDLAIN